VAVTLPHHLAEKFRRFPEVHMGVWRITVELIDGRTFPEVEIGWPGEIIRVAGHAGVPFTAEEVIDVHDGSDL
jgi:hypothetical protein